MVLGIDKDSARGYLLKMTMNIDEDIPMPIIIEKLFAQKRESLPLDQWQAHTAVRKHYLFR